MSPTRFVGWWAEVEQARALPFLRSLPARLSEFEDLEVGLLGSSGANVNTRVAEKTQLSSRGQAMWPLVISGQVGRLALQKSRQSALQKPR